MKQRNYHFSKLIPLFILFITYVMPGYAQERSPAHVGIIYPLSTHGSSAAKYSNAISLHAISGLSGGERGVALYGAVGIVKGDAVGFQSAGIANLLKGSLHGVQMAGAVNIAQSGTAGWQLAGLFNKSLNSIQAQFAGVINRADDVRTVQSAGLANLAQDLHGAQFAGAYNSATHVDGLQMAGAFNKAEEVKGSQIAGAVNVAKKVNGVQIAALLNIADSSDYPIGLINLIKNGEKRLGLSTDEDLSTFLSFRSGGRVLYGILGIGVNPQYEQLRYGLEGGVGVKLINRNMFRLDMEAFSSILTDFDGHDYNKSGFRLLPGLKLSPKLYLYGGPSIHYVNTDNSNGEDLVKINIWDRHSTNLYQAISVGFTGGLQWVL